MGKNKQFGNAPTGGIQYESRLQAIFALGGYQHFSDLNWKQINENNKAVGFEDISFESDKWEIVVQAKHKQNPPDLQDRHWLTTNHSHKDYSLAFYFLSYKKIKDLDPKFLILCTNCNVDTKLFEIQKGEEIKDILNIFENCKIFAINYKYSEPSKLAEIILAYQKNLKENHCLKHIDFNEEDIKRFLSKFLIVSITLGSIENVIKNKLKYLQHDIKFQISSYNYVVDQIDEWYKTKSTKRQYVNQKYIHLILYGEKNQHNIETVLDESLEFKKSYKFSEGNFFQIIPSMCQTLHLKKILQEIWLSYKEIQKTKQQFYNDVLFINVRDNIDIYEDIIKCLHVGKFKYLILVPNNSKLIFDTIELLQNQIFDNKLDKKIIILSKDISPKSHNLYLKIDKKIIFNDFSDASQSIILKKQICFQGKICSLQYFEEHLNLDDLIDECTLLKLYDTTKISVGKKLKKLVNIKEYYIKRNLKKINEIVIEEDIFLKCNEKILVISDHPGTGKSTILCKLAEDWKTANPHYWVLNLDLNFTLNFIKRYNGTNEFFDLLYDHENLNTLFDTILLNSLKKLVIIDGIDELNKDDRNLLFKLILSISNLVDIIKIIISTRSYNFLLEEINNFENYDIVTIEGLSKTDQETFMKKYLKFKRQCEIDCITDVINSLPKAFNQFLNIPLYLEMFTDIFADTIINGSPDFFEVNNSYKLFKLFIDKKKMVFINKYADENNIPLRDILNDIFDRYLEDLTALALTKNLTRESKLFMLNSFYYRETKKSMLNSGLIEDINNEFLFLHKTLEEYVTAVNLIENLLKYEINIAMLKHMYSDIFLNEDKQNICYFIDCMLEDFMLENPIKLNNLSKVFAQVIRECKFNNKSGVLSLSVQGCVNILKLLFDDITDPEILLKTRSQFGASAVLLGAHHTKTVEYLVSKGANIRDTDPEGFTAVHYAITQSSDFRNFEKHLDTVSKSVFYRKVLNNINFLPENLHSLNFKKLVKYKNKVLLHHNGDDFKKILQYFRSKSIDMDTKTKSGTTVLHYVAYCGLYEELLYLVENNFSLEEKDYYDNSIMHYAVLGGSLDIVIYLYNKNIPLDKKNKYGVTPFHFIPISNSIQIFNFFIENNISVEIKDSYNRTILFYANDATSMDLVKDILSKGLNVNTISSDLGYNVLHLLSYVDALNILKYLIFYTNVEIKPDNFGQYPVHYAAEGGALRIIHYFEKFKQITDIFDKNLQNVFHSAAIGDSLTVVEYLVELDMDPFIRDDNGKTPLHYAAKSGSLNVLEFYFKRNQRLFVKDKNGCTILHEAVQSRSLQTITFITEADKHFLNVVDNAGRHVLYYAAKADFLDAVKYFLDIGIHEGLCDDDGNTILHAAASGNAVKTFIFIYHKYIQLNKKNKKEKLPIHKAIEADAIDILEIIMNKEKSSLVSDFFITAARYNSRKCMEHLFIQCLLPLKKENIKLLIEHASETDSLDIINFLIEKNIDIYIPDKYGRTIFHFAAFNNSNRILKKMLYDDLKYLEKGDNSGKRPIHFAAHGNAVDCVSTLLSHDADILAVDHSLRSVFHWCAEGNSKDVFDMLKFKLVRADDFQDIINLAVEKDSLEFLKEICSYCNIDLAEMYGNSLLDIAVINDSIKVIRYLVEVCKISVNIKNKNNLTPLDLALKFKSRKAIEYFNIENKTCIIL